MLTLISTWYNESVLAPFFFSHYDDLVARYIIFVDSDTSDDTLCIIRNNPKAEVIMFTNEAGWDAFAHAERQQELFRTLDGWTLWVDADEFVFLFEIPKDGDVAVVNFAQVFRHRTDVDLDNSLPPVYQRRHGVFATQRCPATLYTKPCLIKAGTKVTWEVVGHHQLHGDYALSSYMLRGVHWQMADPFLAIERNVRNRVGRNGLQNRMLGAASHFDEYTEEGILLECLEHMDDERLF